MFISRMDSGGDRSTTVINGSLPSSSNRLSDNVGYLSPTSRTASRSNSKNIYDLMGSNNGDNSNNGSSTPTTSRFSGTNSPFSTFPRSASSNNGDNDKSDYLNAYSKRVSETLARHGALEEQSSANNGSDNIYSSNRRNSSVIETPFGDTSNGSSSWRQRLEADERKMSNGRERPCIYVTSRATSPQPDVNKQKRTRIARTTEGVETVDRRSRPPRMVDAVCQTITTPEFETIMEMKRKVKPSPSFDYFASVKKSVEEAPKDISYRILKDHDNGQEEWDEADEDFKFEKAPMMQLLPGTTPLSKPSETITNGTPKPTRAPPPIPAEEESESEYEYETDEEEEEDEVTKKESYEAKAEEALENNGEEDSNMDYIDDEDDMAVVASPKRKKKQTFISGTIDIDVLLGKDSNPTTLINSMDSALPEMSEHRKSVDFTNAKPAKELSIEDAPWWLKSKSPLQVSPSAKSLNLIAAVAAAQKEQEEEEEAEAEEEEEVYEEEEESEAPLAKQEEVGVELTTSKEFNSEADEATTTGADGTVTEEQWDEEEWEYYESGEEEEEGEDGEGDEEEEEEDEDEPSDELIKIAKKVSDDKDDRAPWIKMSLGNLVPMTPRKYNRLEDLEEEEDYEKSTTEETGVGESQTSIDRERDKGYREWLEESAYLNEDPDALLDDDDEEEEDKSISQSGEVVNEEEEGPVVTKAQKLVDKIKVADSADVKRILFSLKSIFQTDRNIVYDFVQANGLAVLVELGDDEESQLQNLILRALGQIMLYVDGMNGVMENPKAVQFLYKLIAASNPLVCKTAIKLLLVFVEYTDNNCLLLIQAICAVDKELGLIPWTNIITVIQKESVEIDLATFALTLINKSLYGIPDQDTFYDQTDYMEELGMETVSEQLSNNLAADDCIMQQIQLYNVALKQEDGEPVTEEEISYLDEDATEMGLRTELRKKSGVHSSHFQERKSLRYKTKKIADAEADDTGDIAGVTIRDLEVILNKHGLPTSKSGDKLNELELSGFLEKARAAFVAKLAKGEVPGPEEPEPEEDPEALQKEGEARWEQILANFDRPLKICDLDFSDLQEAEEEPVDKPVIEMVNGIPVPPPAPPPNFMMDGTVPAPPPPPPPGPGMPPPPAPPALPDPSKLKSAALPKKHKKTVKLFWKELRDAPLNNTKGPCIWDDVEKVDIDMAMIEYLFEYRGKDVPVKESKQMLSINREIIVLDHKRSNAINIGMTKLPPPRIIKSAVMKMDSAIINREGVEKLLTMLPTEEEVARIQEAQEVQPDIPLGTAETFLLTLASIPGLEARLRLWAFKMEFEVIEKEVCEPLMDLKMGLEKLKSNPTFKTILSVLLTIGNFLNGTSCKGFQLDYLSKVPEIKDTVHKHSLLYHMTYWVLETYPNSSDLYSEIGPLTRASRTDFR